MWLVPSGGKREQARHDWFWFCFSLTEKAARVFFNQLQSIAKRNKNKRELGEQGWNSGDSTRLPPVWPWFDCRTRRHMCVKFVVGSLPCSEGFSPGTPVFPSLQKPTFPNSNSTWNARTPLNELRELFGASWVNKLHLH